MTKKGVFYLAMKDISEHLKELIEKEKLDRRYIVFPKQLIESNYKELNSKLGLHKINKNKK